MLIACKFKRPKAPVELDGNVYFFVPIDPANADSEHVADVENSDHIQRLLGIPEAYYIARAQSLQTATKPVLPVAPIAEQDPPPPAGSGTGAGTDVARSDITTDSGTGVDAGSNEPPAGANVAATLPPEIVEAAAQLNGLSWQKLKAELAKGGIAKVVIKAALDLELAKPEPDQRGTTLKVLSQALEEA
ncbi:hypothetical protein [Stenotrophomonas maltophilia]|uniref:hypothetical protein n=1 Tax=Stenotrophomonas maltophilia TaxID=40324 RepID=UPI00027A72B6|nr:hypothetical protein [Stenotrophomonas maltophilia]AVH90237.1 hypothetical protein AL480_05085 [Stenotrophomonas maltophilia]EJP77114.1 hypothetical protein A1OC_01924 [Stenotrophomonas maltophilia Ab55555]ELE7120974.1 hypothetical protein [Stenotrophomonas maltophilia]KUP00164.1 hypothetical protein AR274_22565 [Stenotrophomonas maltophilia]MBN4954931.1 hypothetical protein [Stenotrophomonas maltophilia]